MEIMSDVETGSEKYRYISQEDTVELAWADNIEFKYGKDSLYDYIAKKYYEYYLATEMEFNAMVFIHVIFDRELHIIDIKNMSGNREDSSMRDIDSLFKTAIIRTENCWHFVSPPDDKQEYFLVLIPYRIY